MVIDNPKILLLRKRFSWMGKHSGYDQLCEELSSIDAEKYISVWHRSDKKPLKGTKQILTYLASKAHFSPSYDTLTSTATEVLALFRCFSQNIKLLHCTYIEENLGILPNFKHRFSLKLVGTTHQPLSWWRLMHSYPNSISSLDALIVLARREVKYFEQFLPNRVHFIPHGVDTEFFKPNLEATQLDSKSKYPRCVFSGVWLRDTDTLAKVIDKVVLQNPGIKYDLIVPRKRRNDPSFIRIARHDQVCWHTDLSDHELLKVNQNASMLVLPLLDCTANNALLEAISCGVSVISNNVGGLSDYTKDTFADLLPVGDVDGMTNAILRLADSHQEQRMRGKAARSFAEENLSWNQIALKTLEIYFQLEKK